MLSNQEKSVDNLPFACFAGRLGGGFVGVMIGQACAWADVGQCPRVGANEAPCVWRRGWWGGAKRGASWRLAHGTAPGSCAALFGAWMVRRFAARLWRCRCFAQCQPGLRAGGQPAQRCRFESIKKSSGLPKPPWMLRSALSKQEKSVDIVNQNKKYQIYI